MNHKFEFKRKFENAKKKIKHAIIIIMLFVEANTGESWKCYRT